MLRNLRHLLRLAALVLLVSVAPVVGPARADQTVDPTVAAPSNLSALTQSDGYGGQEIVISWFWDTANYDPKYGSFYIEGRDDTAAGQFRWMTGAGTVYSQSVTRGLISSPGVEPGPNDFVPGHAYTLRCYLDVGDGLDAYGVPLTRTEYSNEAVVNIPGIPKPADGPAGLALSVKSKGRKVLLTWSDNSSDETGFRIERRDPGGAWREITTLPANARTWSDTSMGAVGNYAWRVVAEKSGGTETDPSNERTAWCGKSQPKCGAPAFDAPLVGTWTSLDGTTLELAVAGKTLTGRLVWGTTTFDVVLKAKSVTATKAKGTFSVTGEYGVPGRVTLDTVATSENAYRSLKVELLKSVPGVTLPDADVLRGLLRQDDDAGEICVRTGAGLNSVRPGKTVVVVLTFTNIGRRGVRANDVLGAVHAYGATILATHPGKGVTVTPQSAQHLEFLLPALGPARLPATGTAALMLQVVATAGNEELEIEWSIGSVEGSATFGTSAGTVTVPIE